MWCAKCNNHLSNCKCDDIDERLATLKDAPNFASKWCIKCSKHYSRCKCEYPRFEVTGLDINKTN